MEKGKKYMKLIIQVPCYNEEKTLELVYNDLPRHIDGIDTIEYLIINDGSKDKTVQRARELGFYHVVSFRRNKGLARGFMAGLDACLRLGADIIVNTDADNQYCGEDIEKLVRPILERKADMVIGERPIDETEHFSWKKKKFQRMNVVNEYTYTLETIIQAGQSKMAVASVPIRTNPETRPSRLFSSMWRYMKRSASVIIRSTAMYRPLHFFGVLGTILFLLGVAVGVRFLVYFCMGGGHGHVQSLILASSLMMIGFQTITIGLLGDTVAANRKLLEDVQYHVRKMDYDDHPEAKTPDDKPLPEQAEQK